MKEQVIIKNRLLCFGRKCFVTLAIVLPILLIAGCEEETTGNLPKLPLCQIKTPVDSDEVGIGETITISVEAWGESARRQIEVYLYFDNSEIGYFNERPFEFVFDPFALDPGEHTVKAIAYDDIGNVNEDLIRFTVIETTGESALFTDFNNEIPNSWYSSSWYYDESSGLNNTGAVKSTKENSTLITYKTFKEPGNINFYVKNIDGKLEFFDNGKLKARWFEQSEWTKYAYFVSPGEHTFRWKCTTPYIFLDNVNFVEGEIDHTLGEYFGGGIIFYLNSTKLHGLIAAEYDLGTATWGCHKEDLISGNKASSQSDGKANTEAIVTDCSETKSAARLCYDYEAIEGDSIYNDWYLPAPEQLNLLYSVNDIVGNFKTEMYEELYWTSYSWYWGPETFGYEVSGSISFEDGQGHGAITELELNVRPIRTF